VSVLSRLAQRVWKLPPITTPDVRVQRDLVTPTRDGKVLLSDRYYPRNVGPVPTLLVRSCYGRRGLMGFQYGQLFAERGFQVVLQSTRGGYGSGDRLEPLVHEAADGQDTVAWLRTQPWYSAPLGMVGASYLGYAQWAIGLDPPPELAAMSIQMGPRDPVRTINPGGAFALENWLTWAEDMTGRPWADTVTKATLEGLLARNRVRDKLAPAWQGLPFRDAYRHALGRPAPFLEEWIDHPSDGPYWQARSVAAAADLVSAPVSLLSGWYDAFLPDTLDAHRRLTARGVPTRLTIGPWAHTGLEDWPAMFRDGYSWLRTHLTPASDPTQAAATPNGTDPSVRVYRLGARADWTDLPAWPPPHSTHSWFLTAAGALSPEPVVGEQPANQFVYDPHDPTPSVGGATLSSEAGPRDNADHEQRADVLTYTSPALDQPLQLAGPVQATLYVSTDSPHADVFARLCDVAPDGISTNICDALLRLDPNTAAGGLTHTTDEHDPPEPGDAAGLAAVGRTWTVELDLGHTFYELDTGHRLRLQVSGGAHPRWVRNYGTDQPWVTATQMIPIRHQVHHNTEQPSSLHIAIADQRVPQP